MLKKEWEEALRDIIVEVFRSLGIGWKEWGVWRCRDFSARVRRNEAPFSNLWPTRKR